MSDAEAAADSTRVVSLGIEDLDEIMPLERIAFPAELQAKSEIYAPHGDAGHCLNLACFYAALTRESPVGRLPRTFHVWPHGKYEADEAKLAAFQPDAYQAKMAKWMFKHMSMHATATLDDETARYLETVAWETWQTVSQTLLSGQK